MSTKVSAKNPLSEDPIFQEDKNEKSDDSSINDDDLDEDENESIPDMDDEDYLEDEEELEDKDDIEEIDLDDEVQEVDLDEKNEFEMDDNILKEIEDDEEYEESYQRFEDSLISPQLESLHPEIKSVNFEEIAALSRVVRDKNGNIVDPLHTTPPFLTKYEKARIIGTRAEQIDRGSMPYVPIESHIMDGRTIALMEYEQRKIPFIVARPLPNRSIEYWKVDDLEII
jgi:DNA-directed RNA polymerases I, II, and III subunit RPABC2